MQVRDLIEELQTFPPEMRLDFSVQTIQSPDARADDICLKRDADVIELKLIGALVRAIEIAE